MWKDKNNVGKIKTKTIQVNISQQLKNNFCEQNNKIKKKPFLFKIINIYMKSSKDLVDKTKLKLKDYMND